jgi:hypothetical protein
MPDESFQVRHSAILSHFTGVVFIPSTDITRRVQKGNKWENSTNISCGSFYSVVFSQAGAPDFKWFMFTQTSRSQEN